MLKALCVLLIFACGYDYLQNRIPNRLLLLMLAAGVGWNGIQNGFPAVLMGAAKTAAVMLALYPLFKIGCIGAGDVKLLGICAGFLPAAKIWIFLFVSLLVSAIFSLIKMIKECCTKERLYYLLGYLRAVIQGGKWRLYLENEKERRKAGICLSGPVLFSVLMYVGGLY